MKLGNVGERLHQAEEVKEQDVLHRTQDDLKNAEEVGRVQQ
jgi:hypothetical protein